MRSLGFIKNHAVLHALGAIIVSTQDGETSYEPDDLDISNLAAQELIISKLEKSKELQANYAAAMNGGFISFALGAAHLYATDDDRKAMLVGAALRAARGLNQNFYCVEVSSGTGALRLHTPAQMLQVLDDGEAAAQGYLAKLLARTEQVNTATTKAEVDAITWESA